MRTYWTQLWNFLKEIILFGLDAFMVSAAREIARRFWIRLSNRGGTIAALEEPKEYNPRSVYSSGFEQSRLPFLDEYRD